jgi:hypothetical protein
MQAAYLTLKAAKFPQDTDIMLVPTCWYLSLPHYVAITLRMWFGNPITWTDVAEIKGKIKEKVLELRMRIAKQDKTSLGVMDARKIDVGKVAVDNLKGEIEIMELALQY